MDRLLLYWTSEPRKEDALMVLPYDPQRVDEAGRHFDETVRRIQAQEFAVTHAAGGGDLQGVRFADALPRGRRDN